MRKPILGIPFDLIDYRSAIEQIDWWKRSGQRRYVTMTNAHVVMLARRDEALRNALRGADLVLPDGISIVAAARLLGLVERGRVTGPSLMLRLCEWGVTQGYRHYFYGGAEGVARRLAARLSAAYPGLQVAGTYCPPYRELTDGEELRVAKRINDAGPDMVWVGLGAPKQEKWMARQRGRLNAAALIGVGAAFDFHSGNVAWAPAWIRAIGMEWAFRLATEPHRMWRRDLGSALFALQVFGQAVGRHLGLEPQPVAGFGTAEPEPAGIQIERPIAASEPAAAAAAEQQAHGSITAAEGDSRAA
jgi:N-acetylglucosaminyldiphosphoundecaprenol N-acetyl-beta-D-mannosaminyltransferase